MSDDAFNLALGRLVRSQESLDFDPIVSAVECEDGGWSGGCETCEFYEEAHVDVSWAPPEGAEVPDRLTRWRYGPPDAPFTTTFRLDSFEGGFGGFLRAIVEASR